MSTELATQGVQAPEESILSVIARIATSPNGANIEVMERLLAMKERVDADARKTAFFEALSQLQAELPQISKSGRIVVKGVERSRYARIEDIDVVLRPLLAKYGFSFSFDAPPVDTKTYKLVCRMAHKMGHSEDKTLLLAIDASEYRSAVQNAGSTVSYGKRQLIKMHINLIECDEDNDGSGASETLTDEEQMQIEDLLSQLGSEERAPFLKHIGRAKISEIFKSEYAKACTALSQRIKFLAKQGK